MKQTPSNPRLGIGLRGAGRARPRGFTLIELLITIAIGVMLMVVAVPSFVSFRQNAALSDAVSNFKAATASAKAFALKTGRNSFVVPNDAVAGWSSGWYVYSDKLWNNAYDAGTDEVVLRHEALAPDITVSGASGSFTDGYIMFIGAGFPRLTGGGLASGQIIMSVPTRNSAIIMDTAGRVRSCKPDMTLTPPTC